MSFLPPGYTRDVEQGRANQAQLDIYGVDFEFASAGGSTEMKRGVIDRGVSPEQAGTPTIRRMWVLLADFPSPPQPGDGITFEMEWYRVIATEAELDGTAWLAMEKER